MQVIRWQEREVPQEPELRRRMQTQGLSPYAWTNEPDERYAVHSHSYCKVLYCVRGSIRFILPDGEDNIKVIDLTAGDYMVLPRNIRHSAEVGSQGVTCLEAAQH